MSQQLTFPFTAQERELIRLKQSWFLEFGQAVKLGSLLRRTDWDDEQAEALYG